MQTTSYFTFASFSISVVPRFASAIEGAESVVAEGIFMAHGRGCRTFIDIYYKKAKTKKKKSNNTKPIEVGPNLPLAPRFVKTATKAE